MRSGAQYYFTVRGATIDTNHDPRAAREAFIHVCREYGHILCMGPSSQTILSVVSPSFLFVYVEFYVN